MEASATLDISVIFAYACSDKASGGDEIKKTFLRGSVFIK